jgi:hypothetical protein
MLRPTVSGHADGIRDVQVRRRILRPRARLSSTVHAGFTGDRLNVETDDVTSGANAYVLRYDLDRP